jgi:hypothetical protein
MHPAGRPLRAFGKQAGEVHAGYLQKRSRFGFLSYRYFVLTSDNTLRYFEDATRIEDIPKGAYSVLACIDPSSRNLNIDASKFNFVLRVSGVSKATSPRDITVMAE